jgi:predicted nucleic acid-binding protein
MKGFLDSSVLIAAFLGDHLHHQASLACLAGFDPLTGCCGAHSLVEVYSALTRLPGKHRVTGDQALLFLDCVREKLSVIPLTGQEYVEALSNAAALGIMGGTVYDAMLAHCALKANAKKIYTWNVRHYSLCGAIVKERVCTP